MTEQEPGRELLFTVITVCLNPGLDLDATVQSVLRQEFGDWELIVKDGGSTDGTETMTWSDPRVRRVATQDTGIFDAMNQALALARGRFVHFLNAGDVFVSSRVLADVADAIDAHPGVPFFYGDVEKPQSRSGYELYPRRLTRRFLFTNTLCHQGWFVLRETYLAYGGFETDHPVGADPRLLLKMLLRDRLAHAHVGRVVVRYRGGGLSAQPANAAPGNVWCEELRHQLYGKREYTWYSALARLTGLAKRALYDTGLWRGARLLRRCRVTVWPGWGARVEAGNHLQP